MSATGGTTPTSTSAVPTDTTSWLSSRTTLLVIPVPHPVIEALGFHPKHDYGEKFWLPVIGPSALWAHRRLTSGFAEHRWSYEVHLPPFGREIGLGAGTGRNSAIVRTVRRLIDYHLAERIDDQLGVYTKLPPLTHRQVARLPDHLAERHRLMTRRSLGPSRTLREASAEVGR